MFLALLCHRLAQSRAHATDVSKWNSQAFLAPAKLRSMFYLTLAYRMWQSIAEYMVPLRSGLSSCGQGRCIGRANRHLLQIKLSLIVNSSSYSGFGLAFISPKTTPTPQIADVI